jgi:hypothetical protein
VQTPGDAFTIGGRVCCLYMLCSGFRFPSPLNKEPPSPPKDLKDSNDVIG